MATILTDMKIQSQLRLRLCVSQLVLLCSDFPLPFAVQTDASEVGLGAALLQGEKVACAVHQS